ncbi:hypothetical protein HDV62DRAFT_197000 [Trichoderma sp. SZMC 28011]
MRGNITINTIHVSILVQQPSRGGAGKNDDDSGIGQDLRRLCVAGSRHHKTRLATSKHRETQHLDRTNKRHQCLWINHKDMLGASTSLVAVLGLAAELELRVHCFHLRHSGATFQSSPKCVCRWR